MSFWMELRCDRRGAGRTSNRCLSDDNYGPMEMYGNTKSAVSAGVAELLESAAWAGWQKRKDGWVCPACICHEEQSNGSL